MSRLIQQSPFRIVKILDRQTPHHIWGPGCLNDVRTCYGCKQPVVLGDAFVYEASMLVRGTTLYATYLIFHLDDCLLANVDEATIGWA